MIFLYVLNIFLFVFMTIYKVYFVSKYFNLGFFNPISIPFIFFLPVTFLKVFGGPFFLMESGLFNYWFNFALLMTNLSLLLSLVVIYFTFSFCERNQFIKFRLLNVIRNYRLKKARMIFVSLFFLCAFFIAFFFLAEEYGVLNWIQDPRTGYQFYRKGNGHWYALCLLFLSISFSVLMIYVRSKSLLITVFLMFLSLVYLMGSKGFLLSYSIFFVTVLWLKRSSYFKYLVFLVPVVTFGLMLLNFNSARIKDVLTYFDYYVNSAMYFEAYFKSEIDLFYGRIWLTEFYQYLPRSLFPEKPYVYGFLHVNEVFFPGQAERTHTPAFGGPIAAFADFGVVGVVISSLFDVSLFFELVLLFLLYRDLDVRGIKNESNRFYLFLWLLAPSFMVFFGFVYSVIIMFCLMFFVNFVNRVRI